jgi:hypothetical protein
MKYKRPAIIGGGIVAFLLVIFLLVPPTKPLGGGKIDLNKQQGFAPVTNQATDYRDIATRTAPPPSTAPDNAADGAGGVEGATRSDPDADEDVSVNDSGADADADDGIDEEREYRVGYRWASRYDVDDPRLCRTLNIPARVAGCRAFLRESEDR